MIKQLRIGGFYAAVLSWLMVFFIIPFSHSIGQINGVTVQLCTVQGAQIVQIDGLALGSRSEITSSSSSNSSSSNSTVKSSQQTHCPCATQLLFSSLALPTSLTFIAPQFDVVALAWPPIVSLPAKARSPPLPL